MLTSGNSGYLGIQIYGDFPRVRALLDPRRYKQDGVPCTLHSGTCTLHPAPRTLHPEPLPTMPLSSSLPTSLSLSPTHFLFVSLSLSLSLFLTPSPLLSHSGLRWQSRSECLRPVLYSSLTGCTSFILTSLGPVILLLEPSLVQDSFSGWRVLQARFQARSLLLLLYYPRAYS